MPRRLIDQNPIREQIRQERLLIVIERRFSRAVAAEIKRASAEMVTGYLAAGSIPLASPFHYFKMQAIYQDLAKVAVETFASRILDQGKALSLIPETKDFADFLLRLAFEYVSQEAIRSRIANVSSHTRTQIIGLVQAGQADGKGIAEISRSISKAIPSISRLRGSIIARTETHGAANYGADAAARATGLDLEKEWIATRDQRTRDSHTEANGQIRDMEQPFNINGFPMMFAGDPNGPASEVINCRCSISHNVKGYQ